jgi:hypothetical protein
MNELGSGIQIILQTEQSSGDYLCQGFNGLPVVNPCLIVLISAGSAKSFAFAETIRQSLEVEFTSYSGGVTSTAVPCGGRIQGLFRCHAHRVNFAQKLLILVGDDATPFPANPEIAQWLGRGAGYLVQPVLPAGSDPTRLLPSFLQLQNATFWSRSPAEIVTQSLALLGLTAKEARIFISYRRQDTQALCDQLFDSLSHKNFDVYQDRFRGMPGVNFRVRLDQELRDKATVLLLESPGLSQSVWVPYEIASAKLLRLGILALSLPQAPDMLGVPTPAYNQGVRYNLQDGDFASNDPRRELKADALERVLAWIEREHGRALLRRRQIMRENLRAALSTEGAPPPDLRADGLARVIPVSSAASKEYAVWLTTRSPELSDFHTVDSNLTQSEIGLIIGPGFMDLTRKQQINWLSSCSRIECFDEGLMQDVAREMAKGRI